MYKRIYQNDYPHNKTVLEIPCPFCGKTSEIEIPTDKWLKGYAAYKSGELVQRAWPMLAPDQRELLVSGMCSACFDSM